MWNLLALAVCVKLDAFTKAKAAVDKTLAGLKTHFPSRLASLVRRRNARPTRS